MATFYAREQSGVADGTLNPPKQADGKLVGAKQRIITANKNPSGSTQALAAADKLYLGTLPEGATITRIVGLTDTTLGTSTLSIGTLTTAAKYVNAATLTATNVPTTLGPLASARDAGPVTAAEDLYATVAVATVAAATKLTLEIEYIISA